MANDNKLEILVTLKDNAKAGLAAIVGNLDKIKGAADGAASVVLNLKNVLGGLGAGLALKDVVSTFANFDDVMRTVGAITYDAGMSVEQTAKQIADMTALAQKMGAETRYSASEAAEALKFLAMAGFSADKAMAALPGVLNLAAAAGMDLGAAADIATNVLSGLQLPISDLARVNDVLAKAATSANTNVMELGEAFKIAGPAAKGSNQSLEETAVVLGALANNGIKGAEGGHAVKRMLLALQAPTAEAKKTLDDLGITLRDSEGKFRGLIPVIKDLGAAGLDLTTADAIFGKFTATAAVAAAGAVTDIDRLTVAIDNAGGTTDRIAGQMEAGLGGAIRALLSAVEGFKIAFGKGLEGDATEAVVFLTGKVREAIEVVKGLSDSGEIKKWSGAFVAAFKDAVEYIEAFLSKAGAVATSMAPVIDTFIRWSPEIVGVAVGLKTLSVALGIVQGAMALTNAAMGLGSWVTYLKHVQTASTDTNILSVSTASLGNALTVAGAAVGAFFAGWQVGKLISASDAFGLFPITVGESVQIAFGMIDGQISLIKTGFLEVRKAWNEATGDMEEVAAIQASIDAETAYRAEVEATILSIKNKGASEAEATAASVAAASGRSALIAEGLAADAAANATRVADAEAAADKVSAAEKAAARAATAAARESVAEYLAVQKEKSEQAKAVMEQHIADIEMLEGKGVLTANEALTEKLQAEIKYSTDALRIATESNAAVKKVYGEDSKEFKAAQKNKEAALKDVAAASKKISDEMLKMDKAAANSRLSAQSKIADLRRAEMSDYDAYKDKIAEVQRLITAAGAMGVENSEQAIEMYNEAMDKASGLGNAITENGTEMISQSAATTKAIDLIKAAQIGIEGAAIRQKDSLKAVAGELDSQNKAAAESVGDATSKIDGMAKGINDLNQTLSKLAIPELKIDSNEKEVLAGIDHIEDRMANIKHGMVELDLDTSGFDAAINEVKSKIDALRKQVSDVKTTVELKGKASPERGLTETMGNVSKLMTDFQQLAAKPITSTVEVKGDTGSGPQGYTAATQEILSEYAALQDKFESQKLAGSVSFEGEYGNFQQTASMVSSTFKSLYTDLQRGISDYSGKFSEAMKGVTGAANQTGSEFGATTTGMSSDMANVAGNAKLYGQQMVESLSSGSTDTFGKMTEGLQAYGQDFADTMQAQVDAARNMAADVISSGQSMIQSLSSQISGFGSQIASIESELSSVAESTAEKMRKLNQDASGMDEYERLLDDKAHADELYYRAQEELAAGNFEKSKSLMLEAQSLAESLAGSIEDKNSDIFASMMQLVADTGAGAEEALQGQKQSLEAQQEVARQQLEATQAVVENLKNMTATMGDSMQSMLDGLSEKLSETIAALGDEIKTSLVEAVTEAKAAVEEPFVPSVDTSGAKVKIEQLASLYESQIQTFSKQIELYKNDTDAHSGEIVAQLKSKLADAMKEYSAAKKRLERMEYEANVKFTGTASPKKPLTETITNVLDKMHGLQDDTNKGAEFTASFGDMSGQISKAEAAISDLKKKIEEGAEFNVNMTGTGSPTKPLSEKLKDMTASVAGFASAIPQAVMDVDFSAFRNIPDNIAASLDTITPKVAVNASGLDFASKVKNLGSVDLNKDGSGYPVYGDVDVLGTLKKAMQRDRRVMPR